MIHFAVVAGIALALLVPARAAVPADPAGWQTLFSDDFEHGDGAWNTLGDTPAAPTWKVEDDAGSAVYSASGHVMTTPSAGPWRDYRFHLRVKVISGQLHLYFRHMQCGSYFATLDGGPISLTRMVGCPANYTNLQTAPTVFSRGVWHVIDAVAVGGSIKLYLDGALALDYLDSDPVLLGGIGLEALPDDSHVHVNDIVVTGPVDTQSLTWVRTGGPHGGVGYDIRMRPGNPDRLLVTDNASGVSLSSDGGSTWVPSNSGIQARTGSSGDAIPVFCLTVDPNNPDVVWAGTQNTRGIYKSTDAGQTWVEMDNGIVEKSGITFRGFTVDPRDSRTVYAAAQLSSTAWAGKTVMGQMFDLSKGVVYKSTDGGTNWRAVWRGDSLARYIWIDPRDSKVLYVSTGIFDAEAGNSDPVANQPGGVGILKSTDGGATWRVLNQANGLNNLYVSSLFMHPTNPDILLAGTGNFVYGDWGGVYLSTDAGMTWRRTMGSAYLVDPKNAGPKNGDQISAVEFAVSNPQVAYAASGLAMYRSGDGGQTWKMVAGAPDHPGFGPPGMKAGIPVDFQVDPRNPDRIFVNNYTGGNFLSTDGGANWVLASKGYTGADLHSVSVDPLDARRVYTIGRSGPFRSDDGGATWVGLNYVAPNMLAWFSSYGAMSEWYAVAADPRNPGRVLFADEMSGALWLSTEAGLDWKVVFRDSDVTGVYPNRHGFKALAFARSNSQVVYAGMCRDRGQVESGIAGPSFGVFKSNDGGATWQAANDPHSAQQNINVLAVDPLNANTAYAGTLASGILRTKDGGGTWLALNGGLRSLDVRAIAVDAGNGNVLYAGLQKGGVYKSVDGGATWQTASAGMDPGANIRSIVIDPTSSQVVYAAEVSTGVYRSDDGGKLWVQISKGLTMRAVKALAISSDGGTLYAATEGGGVFRLDVRPDAATTVSCASAASYVPGGALAAESIAAGFGQGLATATQNAGATPLPTTLGDVSVSVTDSAGIDRPAPLFFVSAAQINFEVPAGTATGPATVRVLQQNQVVARGQVNIDAVAPGLFTANADGKGVAAALALRVAPDGGQTALEVFHAVQGGYVATPLDLGAATDQVILELFGTGIRGRPALTAVTAKIGGQDAEVLYAGPQGGFAGLDQVNVRLPRSLAGRGAVDVVLTVDGKMANAVTVNIR
jgi:uncharacterized protein (TIGR03437 family)